MGHGISNRPIAEMPIAVLEVETTGLVPGVDRVVELSVVRIDPGLQPREVLASLVNPQRPVAATEIHHITDRDVADAPEFRELVSDFLEAVSGCVLAAYNAQFDIQFLQSELQRAGFRGRPPYVCLMHLRPMLELGPCCDIYQACEQFAIPYAARHHASEITHVLSQLFQRYLDRMRELQIVTFDDLRLRKHDPFVDSFSQAPFKWTSPQEWKSGSRARPRPIDTTAPTNQRQTDAAGLYWDALTSAVADLRITSAQLAHLQYLRTRLAIPTAQVRMFHARAFAAALRQFIEDQQIDPLEDRKLHRLHVCLHQLGWAPGD